MIAICVGHARRGDKGAVSCGRMSEWEYNREVAENIQADLTAAGVPANVYSVYPRNSYAGAIRWLAEKLRHDGAAAAVELHFNSGQPRAEGYEYLYWRTSTRGKALAAAIHAAHKLTMPFQVDRGIKAKGPRDRGALFLRATHCPAVIGEPFFGSNPHEWADWNDAQERLARIYTAGIIKWTGGA